MASRDKLLAAGDFWGALAPIKEMGADKFAVDELRPWRAMNLLVFGQGAARVVRDNHEATVALTRARKEFDECSSPPHPVIYLVELQLGFELTSSGSKVDTQRLRDAYAQLEKACGGHHIVMRKASLILAQTLWLQGEPEKGAEFFSKALAQSEGHAAWDAVERAHAHALWSKCCLRSGKLVDAANHLTIARKDLTSDIDAFAYPEAGPIILALLDVQTALVEKTGTADDVLEAEIVGRKTLENVVRHVAYQVQAYNEAGRPDDAYQLQWALVELVLARWGEGSAEHIKTLRSTAELAEKAGDSATAAKLKKVLPPE